MRSSKSSRPSIAIAHAAFLGGGAEAVTLWAIQALQEEYEVTLVTLLKTDLEKLNARYGTSVSKANVRLLTALPQSSMSEVLYHNLSLFTLRQQVLGRLVRKVANQFSLVISTYNELDLGRPGLQYIHSPFFGSYSTEARRALHFPDSKARRWIKTAIGLVCGVSEERIRQNRSLTNSNWTALLLKEACEMQADVLYPPVAFGEVSGDFLARKSHFLCVGRFGRDKKMEAAIKIIDEVRSKGLEVRLHIVGQTHDQAYMQELETLRSSRTSWLSFEHNVSRDRLQELLLEYKFGLQPRDAEQFGIAVAEMAGAGCIPFVPRNGGQAEIVEEDPRLTFSSIAEAAEKIERVIQSIDLQLALSAQLLSTRNRFSTSAFMEEFRTRVQEMLLA